MNKAAIDRYQSAAEPDWLEQAEKQMSDLWSTLDEIGDPTALELWDGLEDRIDQLVSHRTQQRTEGETR